MIEICERVNKNVKNVALHHGCFASKSQRRYGMEKVQSHSTETQTRRTNIESFLRFALTRFTQNVIVCKHCFLQFSLIQRTHAQTHDQFILKCYARFYGPHKTDSE